MVDELLHCEYFYDGDVWLKKKINNIYHFHFFTKASRGKSFTIENGDNLRRISELQCIYFYCRFVIYFLFAIWRG